LSQAVLVAKRQLPWHLVCMPQGFQEISGVARAPCAFLLFLLTWSCTLETHWEFWVLPTMLRLSAAAHSFIGVAASLHMSMVATVLGTGTKLQGWATADILWLTMITITTATMLQEGEPSSAQAC
jgi:hypothetical protein